MPKNDNAHSVRMTESFRKVMGESAAAEFESRFPLSKSANIEKKFQWAKDVCRYLDENIPEEQKITLRSGCSCGDGAQTAAKLKKYRSKTENLQECVNLFNEKESFASLEYINEQEVLFCYPECYCGCIKRGEGMLSKTWCYCTLGYTKAMFEKFLECRVSAELLESIKAGGSKCRIRVTW